MKLHLGCGTDLRPGYINIDKSAGDGIVTVDLESARLPFDAETVDEIIAEQVFEHLQAFPALMNELHRVMRSGGVLRVTVPHVAPGLPAVEAFQDPTHVRFFTTNSFRYFVVTEWLYQHVGLGYGFRPWSRLTQRTEGWQLHATLSR